jgi:hypothetical protein
MPSALKSEHKALQCGYGSAIPVIEKQQAFLQGFQPFSESVRKSMVPYVIRKPWKSTKATSPIALGPLFYSLVLVTLRCRVLTRTVMAGKQPSVTRKVRSTASP